MDNVSVILGANGAGKSTLLRAISGMIPFTGDALLGDVTLAGKSTDEIVRGGLAHVPQGRGTLRSLTVEENLRLGGYTLPGRRELRTGIERSCDLFPRLGERLHQKAGTLSGGEQQMLAIARALMSRPRFLLLDEPSLGLSPVAVEQVFRALHEIKNETGTGMLMAEQNARAGLDISDQAFVLDAGRIVFSGSPSELRGERSLAEIYLGVTA